VKHDHGSNDPLDLDHTIAIDFEPRCPIMLLLDVSNSMEGEPHQQLEAGLRVFANYLREDTLSRRRVEVGICTFGDESLELWPFVQAMDFEPPELTLRGTTPMGAALRTGLQAVEDRIQEHMDEGRSYYRPWMLLISDGAPTDEWLTAAKLIQQAEKEQRLHFIAVGVEEADMDVLGRISNRSAKKLAGLNFSKLFRWVSKGLISVSHSGTGERVTMPADDWSDVVA
jgi:uncharacterized protein YegL